MYHVFFSAVSQLTTRKKTSIKNSIFDPYRYKAISPPPETVNGFEKSDMKKNISRRKKKKKIIIKFVTVDTYGGLPIQYFHHVFFAAVSFFMHNYLEILAIF